MALNTNPNTNTNTNTYTNINTTTNTNPNNSNSIFQQASCFLLPETEMLDFFDYLAGQKLQLPAQRSYAEQTTVAFRFAAPLPKPSLYKYRRTQDKAKEFRAIRLKQIPSKDH